jgi:hypothetical protein
MTSNGWSKKILVGRIIFSWSSSFQISPIFLDFIHRELCSSNLKLSRFFFQDCNEGKKWDWAMFCCYLNGSIGVIIEFFNIFFQIPLSILYIFGYLSKLSEIIYLLRWHDHSYDFVAGTLLWKQCWNWNTGGSGTSDQLQIILKLGSNERYF